MLCYFPSFQVEALDAGGLSCTMSVSVVVMDVNVPHSITNLPRVVELSAPTTGMNTLVGIIRGDRSILVITGCLCPYVFGHNFCLQ